MGLDAVGGVDSGTLKDTVDGGTGNVVAPGKLYGWHELGGVEADDVGDFKTVDFHFTLPMA